MENQVLTKVCTKCGEEKELDEFHNSKRHKLGKKPSCKKCIKKYQNRPDVKERRRAYNKEYFNKPEVKERRKEYENSTKRKEYLKEYRSRPEAKERRKEYYNRAEVKERTKGYQKDYENSPKRKEYHKEYHQRPEVKYRARNARNQNTKDLTDGVIKQYLKRQFKFEPGTEIPQFLIESKRLELQLVRFIREQKQNL